jgi:hypothetical protein
MIRPLRWLVGCQRVPPQSLALSALDLPKRGIRRLRNCKRAAIMRSMISFRLVREPIVKLAVSAVAKLERVEAGKNDAMTPVPLAG